MRALRDVSIRTKLIVLLLLVVSVALILSGVALLINDVRLEKAALVEHMSVLADVLGANSTVALNLAAADIDSRADAVLVLDSLHLEPSVVFAGIYDVNGKSFATYKSPTAPDSPPPPVAAAGHVFTADGHLELSRPILQESKIIGTIFVRVSMDNVNAQIWNHLLIRGIVLIAALGFTVLLASRLQRFISEPVLQLAQAAQAVSVQANYSLRVPKRGADEVGALVDAFNAMLEQIHQRDAELERHHHHLEEQVGERTRDLQAKTQELARSNAELELFASVASHDLQEPLRMISSYVELLAQRYQTHLDERAGRWIHYAVEGAARMKQLINDLLEFSRVGTRGKPFAPTDCAAVFAQAVANLKIAIADRGAKVTCGALPTVQGDSTQLTQLFQNLIGNGIKFCKNTQPEVRVEAERADGAWRFSVRDNGIGIEPQFAERIFVIFQRLHAREEYSGTGIGLAVCRKIVERHGGRIWVESQPGQGATFSFTLPA